MTLNRVLKCRIEVAGVWKMGCAVAVVAMVALCLPGVALADQWITPTAEELAMKSLPGYPGVPAMFLYREEVTKDDLHVMLHYERIKILTEKGKSYANVELGFLNGATNHYSITEENSVEDISGRTIHPDGTVIPFKGKPYLKTMEKGPMFTYQARVFTLPDVEVGSIIEYRYALRYNDLFYESPDWYLQGPLFVRASHYMWYPTTHLMQDWEGQVINSISWFPVLPVGTTLVTKQLPGSSMSEPQQTYEVTLKDIPPAPEEDFMPPVRSFTYRVLFSYTSYRSAAEFWKSEGKRWSKKANSFIGPDNALTAATQTVIAGANTPEEKLHKIYEAVMGLENTDYTRDRARTEDKAAGLAEIRTANDVLKHGRGDSQELSYLFVGMARAAGMKAYAMLVPNRESHIFTPLWMNVGRQLTNTIAIVTIDGKDKFFGPGERYTPYGQLQWEYTMGQGLRQTDAGTEMAISPGESYKDTKTSRVANLTMADNGIVSGIISMAYEGATALYWRQQALRGDEEGLRTELRTSLEETLPKTLEIKVTSIENLKEYEKPLVVKFSATGSIGASTGKRLVVPADIFTVKEGVAFPQEKRDLPVYFHYPQTVLDAVRIMLPPTMSVEAIPADGKYSMQGQAVFSLMSTSAPSSVSVRRTYIFGEVIIQSKNFPALRTFYSQFEAKDQESIVLKSGSPAVVALKTPAGN